MQFLRVAALVVILAAACTPTFAQERGMEETGTGSANSRQPGVGGSAFHKNDITYSTAVATPHVAWASKLAGGPIRGFFIPSVEFGRDLVELMQRLDLQPTTVSIDRSWDTNCWGIGDYYDHVNRGDRDDFRIVYGYVEKDLTGTTPFDVMVIPGLNGWSRLTRPTRDAILRRVNEGAGLVLIHPFIGDVEHHPFAGDEKVGDTRLWEVSPLVDCPNDTIGEDGYPELNKVAITRGRWESVKDHFITRGVPLALLPEGTLGGSLYTYRATGDVLVSSGEHPVLAVKQYGKGRVVALAYVEEGFLPQAVDPVETRVNWDYWEYQYSLLARAIVWAAGRDPRVAVVSFAAKPEGASLTLAAGDMTSVTVDIAGKNEVGQPIGAFHGRVDLTAGENAVPIPAAALRPPSGWPEGKLIFDLIVRDADGATLDWASATFDVRKHATLVEAKPSAGFYQRDDTLRVAIRAEGSLPGLRLRFAVTDDHDRILTRQERPAVARGEFTYRLADFLGQFASVTAELVDAHGFTVDRLESKPVLVRPKERREREYAARIGFSSLRPYFRAVRLRQIRAAAADTGMTWTEGINNDLDVPRGSFGIYWYDRGPEDAAGIEKCIQDYQRTGNISALPYNARKALYQRTGDKKLLVRTPSFSDPAFMDDLRRRVYKSAEEKAPCGLDYYFVGDEGSLTSYTDPFDFCWGEHTLAAFRDWLRTQYRSLEALNREWKTDFKEWNAVVPYTTEEAQRAGSYGPWADHRTFMEIVFANAYQAVRDEVTRGDPEGHIAVSGTQVTTAYDGCDWYRLDKVIDDFLSYGGGNQWDLHRCFAKPGAMIGFWTGYGSHGLGVQSAIWNAAIHNVLYPQIFWLSSFLNPDFTHSKSARDMGEAFRALRYEGVGKLFLESERLQDGIAIHYSMPSIHAAAITPARSAQTGDESRTLSSDRGAWVTAVNDLGMQFDFVAYEQLEKGVLDSGKYRVFVLPFSAALSPAEVKAIRTFAEHGGVVLADAAAGVMDDHCAWTEGGALNDLFGISTSPSAARSFSHLPGPVSVTKEGKAWGLDPGLLTDLPAAEAVKASTGAALLRIGENDAVIVHRV
ncbi:MAG: beta-galactosidase trimerization domain-containing protein, partial [Armatimonadota bacterium]